jgi:hypothetical protein
VNDPLTEGPEYELLSKMMDICNGAPHDMVKSVAMNLMIHAIRQSVPTRREAEAELDDWTGRAKSLLLDHHYDLVTGLRRTVFPFTQVVRAPFVVNENKFFR